MFCHLCAWSLCDLVFSFFFSLFPLISSTIFVICLYFYSVPFTSFWSFFWLWPPPPYFYQSTFLLDFLFYSFLFLTSPCSPCVCIVSEPMVVCALHPPASHSAPSFLRQYASHLGRTALRREPGGGPERDRAFLNLHRTGSLGTNAVTLHRKACTHLQWVRKVFRRPWIFDSLLDCSRLMGSFGLFFPQ